MKKTKEYYWHSAKQKTRINHLLGIFLAMMVMMLVGEVKGQDGDGSMLLSFPSPTASSLAEYGDTPMNLYSGTINPGLSLYNSGVGDLSIPISLSYSGTGVKVAEIPSWVGLKWSLNAGGVITRVMKGRPDDQESLGFLDTNDSLKVFTENCLDFSDSDFCERYIDNLREGVVDSEPDEFFINFPGGSGSFYFDYSDQVVMSDFSNIKVEPATRTDVTFYDASSLGANITAKAIPSWKITDEQGRVYTFAAREYTNNLSSWMSSTGNAEPYVSAWYLTKIESATGDHEITINYNDTNPVAISRFEQKSQQAYSEVDGSCPSLPTTINTSQTQLRHGLLWPEEIITPTDKISFISSTRGSSFIGEGEKKLDEIIIESRNGELRKSFEFNYDSTWSDRMLLESVTEKGSNGTELPSHSFTYYTSTTLPGRFSHGIDHWGFYNGNVSNGSLIEETLVAGYSDFDNPTYTANREPNSNYASVGMLKKIEYPNGGHSEFEYEAHDYGTYKDGQVPIEESIEKGIEIQTSPNVSSEDYEAPFFVTSRTGASVSISLSYSLIRNDIFPPGDWPYIQILNSSSTVVKSYTAPSWFDTMTGTDSDTDQFYLNPGTYTLKVVAPNSSSEAEVDISWTNTSSSSVSNPAIVEGAGGPRIKKVTIHDGMDSANNIVKEYDYRLRSNSNKSSGVVSGLPKYYYTSDLTRYDVFHTSSLDECSFVTFMSSSVYPLSNGTPVEYQQVKETITSGGSQGYQYYDYYTSIEHPDESTALNGFYPMVQLDQKSGLRGKLKANMVFNSAGDTINVSTSEYEILADTSISALATMVNPVVLPNQDKLIAIGEYAMRSYWQVPSIETSRVNNGTANALITSTSYEYDEVLRQLRSTTETNSDDSERVTKYRYAHEEYTGMKTANMLSQPYSVTVENSSGHVLSRNWTTWNNSISGNSNWNVLAQWQWEGSSDSDTDAPQDPTSEAVEVAEVTKYDSYGNILEAEDAQDVKTAYQWSDDKLVPVGIFSNADVDDIFTYSFAYEGDLGDWVFKDRLGDGGTSIQVTNGKLSIADTGAVNGDRDRVVYRHSSEIPGTVVWEFDVQVANSDSYALLMGSGGSSWNDWSGGGSEASVWAHIRNEDFYYYDRNLSAYVEAKSNLEIGKTYSFKMIMNSDTDRVDYYINGELVGENIIYANASGASGIQELMFGNFGHTTLTDPWYIDNVRFYPEDAQAQSREVDPVFKNTLSVKDVSGSTNRFRYDELGRLKEVFNPNGERISRNAYFYSLDSHSSFEDDDPNRIESITYTNPADTTNKVLSVTYLDGLGRPIQSQTRAADGTAIITGTLYDAKGRPHIASRPIELDVDSYTNGFVNNLWGTGFDGDPGEELPTSSEIYQYYDTGFSGATDAKHAYTQTKFEASPLSRPVANGNAASALRIGQNESLMSYGLNSGSEDFSGFTDNELTKTVSTDPNGNHAFSFTDGWGNTIASMVDMDGDSAKDSGDLVTQFQYDLRNQLKKVTDPRGLETDYDYNQRGQLVEKDMPDKDDPDNYRYDKNGNLRFVQSAKHKNNGSQTTLINSSNSTGTFNETMPGDGAVEFDFVMQVNGQPEIRYKFGYEDGSALYNFVFDDGVLSGSGTIPVGKGDYKLEVTEESSGQQFQIDHDMIFKPYTFTYNNYDELNRITETGEYYGGSSFTSVNAENDITGSNIPMQKFYYGEANAKSDANNTKGRLAKVEYRDLHDDNLWGTTWYSYNTQGLVEWIIQDLPGSTMGEKKIEYSYDELGRMTEMSYQPGVSDDYYFRYSYDDLGRLSKTESRNSSGGSWLEDAAYTYVADGQFEELNLGGNDQSIDYSYNSAGWLRFINNPDNFSNETSPGYSQDRFGLELRYYNSVGSGDTGYNGNIGRVRWEQALAGTDEPDYQLQYDAANRLKEALFSNSQNTQDDSGGFDVSYTYDDNGNIKSLLRKGMGASAYPAGNISNIAIEATSNRIDTISYQNGPVPFSDKLVSYDANGNMIKNEVNGLSHARYDHRNLPYTLSGSSSTVYNTYDADGQRVSKKEGSTTTTYIRGADGQTIATYENGSIDKWNILSGGDVVGTVTSGGSKEYFIKDHLGSTRTVVNSSGTAVAYFDFYPYGKLMAGRFTTSNDDRYKFTGHELDEEAGLDLSYAGARYLDSEIGSFLSVDPLRDQFPGLSPYSYVGNDPISYVDPTGMYRVGDVGRNRRGNVLSRATRVSLNFASKMEGTGTFLGSIPIVGSITSAFKIVGQYTLSDPSYRPGIWDFASVASLGILSKSQKIYNRSSDLISGGGFLSNLNEGFINEDLGRDKVLFDVATSATGNLFNYEGDSNTNIVLNENFGNMLAESHGGLDAAKAFTSNYLELGSSLLGALAKGNDLDLTTEEGRAELQRIYNENKSIFDAAIFSGAYHKTIKQEKQ